jgi:hypothetical protein
LNVAGSQRVGSSRISAAIAARCAIPLSKRLVFTRPSLAGFGRPLTTERGTPRGREKIVWKLIINVPVKSLKAAIELLTWYAMRWKIEVFHKILKSGCKAEESKLRSSERLVNLIAIFCIIAWRVFWLTMLHRAEPDLPSALALDPTEIYRLA